jgi:DNA-binding MarR family transcriptional regulator
MGNDNDLDIVTQPELREAIDQQMRELSTRTVIFHHFVGERLGLNPTDHKCLDIIIRATNPITAGPLADETGLTTGAITGVMDRLEQAGYVKRERDPNDRRLIFINPLLDRAMTKIGPLFAP